MQNKEKIEAQEQDRKKYTELILKSDARNKIIIAGAGTGKSFTFQQLLKLTRGENLALTFINNLANDLQKDLDGLAEANTFHSFCKKLLHKTAVGGINEEFHYFPKLSKVIQSDALILERNIVNFDAEFHQLIEGNDIDFF